MADTEQLQHFSCEKSHCSQDQEELDLTVSQPGGVTLVRYLFIFETLVQIENRLKCNPDQLC